VTCTEFIALLDELIEGGLPQQTRDELQSHLAGCEHCEVTLSTTRKTIQIYREHDVYELPDNVRDRIRAAIISRCKHGC
jgi:anti-sigma factor RsiW